MGGFTSLLSLLWMMSMSIIPVVQREQLKTYFLSVEQGSDFDKSFNWFLENSHLDKVDGFVDCDSDKDYNMEDLFYNNQIDYGE
jgi:hypothetical protein